MISLLLTASLSLATPPDCPVASHPTYTHLIFQMVAPPNCPYGGSIDMACWKTEDLAAQKNMEAINTAYTDTFCLCYKSWLVNHNDALFLQCTQENFDNADRWLNEQYAWYLDYCWTWCCEVPR